MIGVREFFSNWFHGSTSRTRVQGTEQYAADALATTRVAKKPLKDRKWTFSFPSFNWLTSLFSRFYPAASDKKQDPVTSHLKSMGVEERMTYEEYCQNKDYNHNLTRADFTFCQENLRKKPGEYLGASVDRYRNRLPVARNERNAEVKGLKLAASNTDPLGEFDKLLEGAKDKQVLAFRILLYSNVDQQKMILRALDTPGAIEKYPIIYNACLELDKCLSDIELADPTTEEKPIRMLQDDKPKLQERLEFWALKTINAKCSLVDARDEELVHKIQEMNDAIVTRIKGAKITVTRSDAEKFNKLSEKHDGKEDIVKIFEGSTDVDIKDFCKWIAVKKPALFMQLFDLLAKVDKPLDLVNGMLRCLPRE